jgi:SAM-dependent methyltransferase
MSGLYTPDLARIHAEGYNDTFEEAHDWLAAEILHGPVNAHLFDIGCGDGTWLSVAEDRGVMGEGVDLSPAFVEIAQARGLLVKQGNAADIHIPKGTTAVTCLGEVLSYIDTTTKRDTLLPVAQVAYDALPSGGLLFADLIGPRCLPHARRNTGADWQMRIEVTVERDRLTRRIETQVDDRVDTVIHQQSRRHPNSTMRALQAMGWRCEILDSYGPAGLLPGRFAIKLTKP